MEVGLLRREEASQSQDSSFHLDERALYFLAFGFVEAGFVALGGFSADDAFVVATLQAMTFDLMCLLADWNVPIAASETMWACWLRGANC